MSSSAGPSISDSTGFKIMENPRKGKSLMVLDVDQTIFNLNAVLDEFYHLAARPYLQEFLTHAYENFDLALWSSTNMAVIDKKVKHLEIINQENYKIAFYLGRKAMVPVQFPDKEKPTLVKPLSVIWQRFPQYSAANTIICDDVDANFYHNPKNGILVHPYDYTVWDTDQELRDLDKYVQHLFHSSEDYSAVDHADWKNHPSVAT